MAREKKTSDIDLVKYGEILVAKKKKKYFAQKADFGSLKLHNK